MAALRFFYVKTLKKNWSTTETPYPKKAFQLPTILSQEEVERLIDAASTSFHRTPLMTLYATGVRRAELTHLKVTDVNRHSLAIHVRGGKGRKDRDVMLSHKLLGQGTAIQEETNIYLHVSKQRLDATASPLDALKVEDRSPQDKQMSRPPLEVADLVRGAGEAFIERNRQWIRWKHVTVLLAIAHCRTAALGGHLDECTRCGHRAISYNSCRNRHCPKCQAGAREHRVFITFLFGQFPQTSNR